jgi:hypothetical protein
MSITVTFSKAMNATTLNIDTFTLTDGTNSAAGSVTYDMETRTASFTPSQKLMDKVMNSFKSKREKRG